MTLPTDQNGNIDWTAAGTAALQQNQSEQIRNSLVQALPANPDKEAELQRYAGAAQVPITTARAMPDQIKLQAQMSTFDTGAVQRAAPHFAQWLTDSDNARLVHDDIPTTIAVEQHTAALGQPPQDPYGGHVWTAGPGPTYRERLTGWLRDLVGLPPAGSDPDGSMARAFLDHTAQQLGTDRQGLRDAIGGMSPVPQQFSQGFMNSFLAGLAPDQAGPPDTTGGQIASGVGGLAGFIMGAPLKMAAAGVERVGGSVLTHTVGESWVKALGKDMTRQAATLGIASGITAAGQALDTTSLADAAGVVGKAAKSGAEMGAVFGAAGRLFPDNTVLQFGARALGINATLDAINGARPWDDRPLAQKVFDYGLNSVFALNGAGRTGGDWLHDAARADTAAHDAQVLGSLADASASSKLRERSPEAFRQFVQDVTQDGPVSALYVDAKTLAETLHQAGVGMDELEAKMPALAQQLPEALSTGGQVSIPVEDFATHIAGGPLQEPLLQHLRTDPEGMTLAESQAFYQSNMEQLAASGADAAAQRAADEPLQASRQQVYENIRDQLAATGRFRPEVNDAYAALHRDFYTTLAERAGVLPHELMAQYPLRIGATDINGFNQSVSTRVPTAKKALENPLSDMLTVGLESSKAEPKAFAKNVDTVTGYSNYRDAPSAKTHAQKAERFIQHVKDNLLWLHDSISPDIRNRSKLWYDGARNIVDRWVPKFGYTDAQTAGVLAVLSPQKDWFMNVSLGERILDAMKNHQDTPWSPEMTAVAGEIWNKPQYKEQLAETQGKTLGELKDAGDKAMWIRTYDQAHNSRNYRLVTPDGGFGDHVVNSDGETRSKAGWGSLGEIAKAVSILENGDIGNISDRLGGQHKVRNFYNNIFDPNDKHGSVTIDTHAVAAGLLRPLSGSSPEVEHNFGGGGSASSAEFGAQGTYGLYAEAYRRAAEARGILPREMQPITWEAVRGLFTPGFKSQAKNVDAVAKVWENYKAKRISLDETRKQILALAGDINEPDWVGSPAGTHEGAGDSSYAEGLPGVRLPGRGAGTVPGGTGAGPAARAEGVLNQGERGAFDPGSKTIALLKGADLSTFLHESGHFFLDTLANMAARPDAPQGIRDDMSTVLKSMNVPGLDEWHRMTLDEQRDGHEQFARGFEAYLLDGKAPSLEMRSLFQRFRSWLLNVYKSLSALNVDLSPEVRGVFDRLLASQDAIHQAETARRYMPMFETPEKASMSPEEWAQYQALGKDATETAIEQLSSKTVRDMAWLDRTRSAALKRLTKDAAEKRAVITREVRAEVMSQPIYRAWSFLTGKDTTALPVAPTEADLAHAQAARDWEVKRVAAEASARATTRAAAWDAAPESKATYATPQAKGLARGQWLVKNGKRIGLDLQRSMLDWEASNPRPVAPAKAEPDPNLDPTTGAGKLNAEQVKAVAGEDIQQKLSALRMTGAKGLDPGLVADMFGFRDGQQLAKALTLAEHPKFVIEGLTDQRMLERHGEIADPQALARAADDAVHNEVRTRFIATELRTLNKAIGPARDLANAAKEVAASVIDGKRVRDIAEGPYTVAEAKAAKEAEKRQMAGDTAGAAVAKRDQLLNNQLSRAARDALEYVTESVDYLAKFNKASVRENIDLEYRDQIDELLDRADIRRSVSGKALDKRESLVQFVERMASNRYEPQVPEHLLNEAQRWHYKDMPLVAFRGLVDAVKSIEHLGKLKDELRDGQETRRINDLADEVKATTATLPQRTPESNRGLSRIAEGWMNAKAAGRSLQASLLKMEQMIDWLDARNPNGVLNRVVFRRLSAAGVHENEMLVRVKSEIDRLVESHLPDVTRDGGKIYTATGLIDKATGQPQRLTKKQMLMLAGNMGNESNAAKLSNGEGWVQAEVWNFLNAHLSKADWDFVAGIGKALEGLWPEKLAMSRRLGNTNPEKIAPRAFDTPHGRYAGWYWPMIYDPARAQDVAERGARAGDALFENTYSRANTDTGRMNTRNENYARPLLLDLDAIPRVIKDEIHDIAFREAVIDADRFLANSTVRQSIIDALSQQHYDQLRPWLQSIANDGKSSTESMRALKFFADVAAGARTRATIVGLGYRISTILVHGASAGLESVAELGPKWMYQGLKDFANPGQWAANKDFVFERSGEMRNRMNEVDRDVRDHLRQIDTRMMDPATGTVARGADSFKAHAYTAIAAIDMASALPTWMGAYKKALTPTERGGLGMGEEDAVYFADKTVRNAHGGTGVKDMAAVQRGPEVMKLFTMFYTFWNHNVNRLMDTARLAADRNTWHDSELAATVIIRTLVYTIGVQVMHSMLHPPKKDAEAESWLAWAGKEFLSSAFAGIPVFRDLAAHYLGGKDYSATPAAGLVKIVGDSGTDALNALQGKQANPRWLKHTITTAGAAFALPLGQPASTAQFLWDVGNGQEHPQTAGDWWNGAVHGSMAHH